MGLHTLHDIAIAGIAACVPRQVFHTSDYTLFSEKEKIDFTKHVGVESKRDSGGKYTSADLCYEAAERLINELDWDRKDIGLLVLVTQSSDYLMPASAIVLQERLKLPQSSLAFDINLGCSGWVYGLSVVGSMMRSLNISKAILLTGETSIIVDYRDKGGYPLLGDAGSATALSSEKTGNEMQFNLQSDGSRFETIIAADSGARHLSLHQGDASGLIHKGKFNGQKVLAFCLTDIIPAINALMDFSKAETGSIDYFVFHQANRVINESLRKKIGVPVEKFPYSIAKFGNTSSASIPLTMVTELPDALRSKPLSLLCSGFGVGLSWGTVHFKTDKIVCPPLVEVD